MTEQSKPITKFVTLKVTYNSYYIDSPETWDWNAIVDVGPDENIEIISVKDSAPHEGCSRGCR